MHKICTITHKFIQQITQKNFNKLCWAQSRYCISTGLKPMREGLWALHKVFRAPWKVCSCHMCLAMRLTYNLRIPTMRIMLGPLFWSISINNLLIVSYFLRKHFAKEKMYKQAGTTMTNTPHFTTLGYRKGHISLTVQFGMILSPFLIKLTGFKALQASHP